MSNLRAIVRNRLVSLLSGQTEKLLQAHPQGGEFVQQIGIPLNQGWYLMYLDMDDVGWKIMGIQISSVEYILTYSLTLPKRDEIGVCDITLFD
jgi:hypothetical protein